MNKKFENNTDVYKSLFENSSYAKLLVNSDGVIIKNNNSFLSMFGYVEDEVLNESVKILMPEKLRESHGKHLETYIKVPSKKVMGLARKIQAQKKDGTLFSVEITLNYVQNEDDVFVDVTVSDIIISDIKKELSEKKEEFKLATQAANIGIWSAILEKGSSVENMLTDYKWVVNDQVAIQMGFPPGHVLSLEDFQKVIHKDDLSSIYASYEKAVKENQRYDITYRVVTPKGETRYIESKGVVRFNDNGQVERIDGVTMDVTDRKSAEMRQAIINNITQKLNSNISVFDFCKFIEVELGKILSIQNLFVLLYDSETCHLTSIFISDSFNGCKEGVNRKYGNGLCEYIVENKVALKFNRSEYENFIAKKGIHPYRVASNYWMGSPLMSEGNAIGAITLDSKEGVAYSESDLTLFKFIGVQLGRLISRKQNHYRLKLLNTTLEERVELRTYELNKAKNKITENLKKEKELSSMKSRFVSTASHQFRTPLTVIQTNLGILELQKNAFNEEHQEKFDKISKRIKGQISKMTSMMDDLLTIGKINENGINFKPIPVNIVSLCQKVVHSYNGIQTDGRTIEIIVKGNQRDVLLDPVLMEHVLSALISNAFKYSVTKPNPILTIDFLEKEFQILITDFGIGIPQNDIENIHEPFFRASNAIDIEGTGLGTAIIKEYVEINKGLLHLDSKINEFTQFKLIFKN